MNYLEITKKTEKIRVIFLGITERYCRGNYIVGIIFWLKNGMGTRAGCSK
jgi:hypothetical protein